ncbi:helix-turn-helix domain-containing protein [Streptosporangium sp. NPDC049078]|uniref:helix-turn-helix domain-containing protein n=1 Tax=Streptosporangium sp. NPDC049078 TaxID=3155767 RepID=UPI003417896A
MARKGRRATFEEKVFALRLMEQGMSPDRVAETLGVGRESVFRWRRQARAGRRRCGSRGRRAGRGG